MVEESNAFPCLDDLSVGKSCRHGFSFFMKNPTTWVGNCYKFLILLFVFIVMGWFQYACFLLLLLGDADSR